MPMIPTNDLIVLAVVGVLWVAALIIRPTKDHEDDELGAGI